MAEWEPQQCVNTEMNGGLVAAFFGTGDMEVNDTEWCAIRLTPDVAIYNRATLQMHGVKMVAVISDS
jgi:hypothetical protein